MRQFIFSNYYPLRLARHVAFWLFYFVGTALMHSSGEGFRELFDPSLYHEAFVDAMVFLPSFLFGVYFGIYFILPAFLKSRNILLVLSWGIVVLVISCIAGFYGVSMMSAGMPTDGAIAFVMHRCIANLITFSGAAMIIKLIKGYVVQQRAHELLCIERTRNKIQLLKKQMQPEILFYSLRKIYEDIDRGVVYAPDMILKLSDLLSYLLYESDSAHIGLREESSMMENYLGLKELEHPGQLITEFQITGDPDRLQVSPGVLLPVLEPIIQRMTEFGGRHSLTVNLGITGLLVSIFLTGKNLSGELPCRQVYEDCLRELDKRLESFRTPDAAATSKAYAWGFTVSLQFKAESVAAELPVETGQNKNLMYEPT